ncbi:hypothetical protein BDN70DRAFT_907957 [Pholiota conissans]|uniref:Protein-S-isoprenylcysteine O-methyltransferase n=1 Tax=Pholiota conissans TaxID=109636 RepID=A0A9P6CR60_9AGAR|nr:hypothetical protein BDN70DRAFT_907957 [Pholiota conissans]
MSLLKIPFSLSILWAVKTIVTAPQPPARPTERVGPIGLEVYLLPPVIKACFYLTGLAEIASILTNHFPENVISRGILALLVNSSPVDRIQITWPFFIAWICCLSGAYIRRQCYKALGESFTFEISLRKNHTLVTSGPYAFVRHPSYSSAALGLYGAFVCQTTSGAWLRECSGILQPAWAGWLIGMGWVLAAAIFVVAIVPRLDKEDRIMKGRFGAEWDQWAMKVPYKLIPMVF